MVWVTEPCVLLPFYLHHKHFQHLPTLMCIVSTSHFDITAFPHLLSLSNPHPHIHRHVMLPKEIAKLVPRGRLMSEKEWRSIGVQQSPGWIHYMIHKPEPHILLFRRPITRQQMM